MIVRIVKSVIEGASRAPPSKSMTHRALVCSALSRGLSRVRSPLASEDTEATRRVLSGLGVPISKSPRCWEVEGGGLREASSDLFCGESATTLRLMTAVCSLVEGESRLTGGPSLLRRPVGPLIEGLRQLGVGCGSRGGYPPVTVRGEGRIRGGLVEVPGDVSSQFVSALLIIAPFAGDGVSLRITTPLESEPYVSMTIEAQEAFGVRVHASEDMRNFRVERQDYRPAEFTVEGDWSSASFLLAAGTLAGSVSVGNLDPGSSQADSAILDILERMGASVAVGGGSVTVQRSALRGIEADLSNSPDLFPVVASLCAAADGVSVLHGLRRLRFKESDRVGAMAEGLGEMGVRVETGGGSAMIEGGTPRGGLVDPHGDHRIAMALGVLGLVAQGETVIRDAGCVSKSYPFFWQDIEAIGANVWREEYV